MTCHDIIISDITPTWRDKAVHGATQDQSCPGRLYTQFKHPNPQLLVPALSTIRHLPGYLLPLRNSLYTYPVRSEK